MNERFNITYIALLILGELEVKLQINKYHRRVPIKMVDSPISFLSQKLEKLPLSTDYLFISNAFQEKAASRLHQNFAPRPGDGKAKNVAGIQATEEAVDSSGSLSSKKYATALDFRDIDDYEHSELRKKGDSYYEEKNNRPPFGPPIVSESLPTNLIRSPSKRKRSSDDTTCYDDSSAFTKSCDFEVLNICQRDFRSIQRTLSFDDDLLRCDNAVTGMTSLRSQSRPICRLTSKSQPSSSFERRTPLEKPRKFKIIQITELSKGHHCDLTSLQKPSLPRETATDGESEQPEHSFKSIACSKEGFS
eukprot:TCONS_00062379-protein